MSRSLLPAPKTSYFPLGGGLDLLTPAIAQQPGRAFDALNYEPEISGGYRRINGYERFDGRSSPTANAAYISVSAIMVRSASNGSVVTGTTSGVTARLLATISTGVPGAAVTLVLNRATGNFQANEFLTVGSPAETIGRTTAASTQALSPSDDADYLLLAANDLRADIGAVPGSGSIRGVAVLNDTVYAFRDNVGGTAGQIYRSSVSGWTLVSLGHELQFSNGSSEILVGDTVTNSPGTASGVVTGVVLRSGSWGGGTAAGSLFFATITNSFANGDPIKVGGIQKATAAAASAAITRAPGGLVEAEVNNFSGSTTTRRLYGCDGVNLAFEFDGVNYWPIRTGMAEDKPSHLAVHRNRLFLSFKGSLQFSGAGTPHVWTVVLGAGELATGDTITGMMPVGAEAEGAALAVFTTHRLHVLYGSTTQDFLLQTSKGNIGYAASTIQQIANSALGVTDTGVQSLNTTQAYGNFEFASITHLVQPLVNRKRGLEVASTTLRAKNQYRLYFSDGTALVVGLSGDAMAGIMPLDYTRTVRCIWSSVWGNRKERTFFGSDDGYIYEDNVGTSFDGQSIEAYLRLAFNHDRSPIVRKRWRRAVLEVKVDSFAKVNVSYDLGYGNPDVAPPPLLTDASLAASTGAYWDQMFWDQFVWDTQTVLSPSIPLDGTEKNLSLTFYSKRAQDSSHTLQGATLVYSPRRLER